VQESFEEIRRRADAWLVGYYLLMPDHLHLFCAPRDLHFTIEQWLAFWKREFSRKHLDQNWAWQRNGFHHRLRDPREYADKWRYVQENPVRKGLVGQPEDWPFQGTINTLRW
jgi:putative transposase